ncbi:MAG: TetR/AcrR family transcriptional regulator [Solirubrobacterales bacterium]|nr:TetR/AcrR family transcriptional regulator [Solirubrobacterales bacterium]
MVATPWGNSDTLRDRRLRPGPGVPREDVVENQRERLFGAMVASVAERGYAATTVTDLVELSGVSSRSFYDLFADKQACFVAALAAIIQAAMVFVAQSVGEGHGASGPAGIRLPEEPGAAPNWDEQARRGFAAFAEMVEFHAAAAKMALLELYSAGAEGVAPLERAERGFEGLIRTIIEQSPERAGMPEEMITALIGAHQEIARTRLRRGTLNELAGVSGELWELALAYRPPPQPLQLTGRLPKAQPESLDGLGHAERALRALTIVVSERGYADTTVDEVLKRAQMSATTFYAHFSGKDDAMLAAIDTACAQAVAAAMPAFSRQAEWPDGIRAAYGALLNFLASQPALAKLIAVDAYTAGDAAIERRELGLRPLAALIENSTSTWMNMPPVVYETISGGAFHLLHRTAKEGGVEALPRLAPVLTYLTLFPFLGAEEACEVANGAGVGRRNGGNSGGPGPGAATSVPFQAPLSPTIHKALWLVAGRSDKAGMTPAEVAAEVDTDVEVVRGYLRELTSIGALAEVDSRRGEPAYVGLDRPHQLQWGGISTQQSSRMSAEEREGTAEFIWEWIANDVARARAAGTFEERLDRYLVRVPLRVDEKGWRELTTLHESTLRTTIEIQARSAKRLRASGEHGFEARTVQLVFEMPEDEPDAD